MSAAASPSRSTGTWDGETLRLVEDFVYEDGSTERRVWTLRKTGPDTWAGTAPGVIGTATGREAGDMFNWRYTIDLPIPGDETLRVSFDDWMWLLSDDRLLNRAYMRRFGVPIGEVIITFERRYGPSVGNVVDPRSAPRMASRDPAQHQPRSLDPAVLFQRLHRVGRAGRLDTGRNGRARG
jgi:hypothetical protein